MKQIKRNDCPVVDIHPKVSLPSYINIQCCQVETFPVKYGSIDDLVFCESIINSKYVPVT